MEKLRFLSPIEGALLLSGADGTEIDGKLLTPVCVAAPQDCAPEINGIPGIWNGEAFAAQVPLEPGFNVIAAQSPGMERQEIRVWWLKGAARKVHMTVDDCIRCFEDLTLHADSYTSIFDNPFLAIFREAHVRYGSKVHINVFYESVDGRFNLSMMTDRYREEFIANAGWLSLSFHALREFPDYPYQNADYAQVCGDCKTVTDEIIRFAGEEVLRESTTLHWGEANRQGVRALRDAGFRALCGYLQFGENGQPYVSYHLNADQVGHAQHREGFVDFEEDVWLFKLDFVLDSQALTAERVIPFLDELSQRPHEGQMILGVIHEQYFYPDYVRYEPDYAQRVLNVARWAHEHGYEPISLTDVLRNTANGQ